MSEKMFGNVRLTFGTLIILENLQKVVGNLRKIVRSVVISMFMYSKQNITCPLMDMNFIFLCSTRYLTRSLTREISS